MSRQKAGSEVRVRRGTSKDFDAVATLHEAVAAEARWIGSEAPLNWTPERREAWCRRADDEEQGAWFLAEEPNLALLGYLSVGREGSEHADFGMAVRADSRGHGVGGRLLDAAIAWCADRPISKLSCQVWPHNGDALALYRSRGFEIEGRLRRQWRRRNGQLWDALLMGLILDRTSPGSGLPDSTPPDVDLNRPGRAPGTGFGSPPSQGTDADQVGSS